jgi:hypothetical protein
VAHVELPYLLTVAAFNAPAVAVSTVAIVLALVRPLPARARGLLVAGGALLASSHIGNAAWQAYIPTLLRDRGITDFNLLSMAVSAVLVLLELAGIGLLVAAALAGRSNASVS